MKPVFLSVFVLCLLALPVCAIVDYDSADIGYLRVSTLAMGGQRHITGEPDIQIFNNDGKTNESIRAYILPDGTVDLVPLKAGNYTAVLPLGAGGNEERIVFLVGKGYLSYVVFQGNAIGGHSSGC